MKKVSIPPILLISGILAIVFFSYNNRALSSDIFISSNLLDSNNISQTRALDSSRTRIYLAKSIISYGIDTSIFSSQKIEAALNLLALSSEKYEFVQPEEIHKAKEKLYKNFTTFDIAKEVNAKKILFIKLEQLRNMLRSEISVINTENPNTVSSGEGYSLIHYFTEEDNKPVYDPSLLASMQRAFAVAENDSLMFKKQNIFPAPLLAICGVEFINENQNSDWDIFNNELVRSYEITETIFEILNKSNKWITFDIDSRDYIYSMFNLYGVENNIAPSIEEIAALKRFGVTYYILGRLRTTSLGLEVRLALNEIKNNSVTEVKKVSNIITINDLKKTMELIKELTKKLLTP